MSSFIMKSPEYPEIMTQEHNKRNAKYESCDRTWGIQLYQTNPASGSGEPAHVSHISCDNEIWKDMEFVVIVGLTNFVLQTV